MALIQTIEDHEFSASVKNISRKLNSVDDQYTQIIELLKKQNELLQKLLEK